MDIATALFDQDEVTRRTNLEIWNEGKDEGWKLGKDEGWKLGKDEGWKLGKDEGDKNASLRIAQSMKNDGVETSQIAQYTGLSIEQIEKL